MIQPNAIAPVGMPPVKTYFVLLPTQFYIIHIHASTYNNVIIEDDVLA